ncbi:MAG: glycosyltransferase, partial [Candidatus Pacebacteria bacterium]|nr:glycosyltransferase [Candidatus Paceibacterota bacterium]
MKICWFGIYDKGYSRNIILMKGLQLNGVEFVECKSHEVGLKKYVDLFKKLRALKNNYDVLYCAFPLTFAVVLARLFQKRKVVVDAFYPKYNSVTTDRKTFGKYHPRALFFLFLDWFSVRFADLVVVDTHEHEQYWSRWCDKRKIEIVPVGVYSKRTFPIEGVSNRDDGKFLVHFHGTYIPLQGVDKIIEVAEILKEDKEIVFRLVGRGQQFSEIEKMIQKKGLSNIILEQGVPFETLNKMINESDISLGIFGKTPKTDRVVPNKLYEALGAKKAIITKDTEAVRHLFTEEEVYLCDIEPCNIVEAIL